MSGRKTTGTRKNRSSSTTSSPGARSSRKSSARSGSRKSASGSATATATRKKPRRPSRAKAGAHPKAAAAGPTASIVVRTILPEPTSRSVDDGGVAMPLEIEDLASQLVRSVESRASNGAEQAAAPGSSEEDTLESAWARLWQDSAPRGPIVEPVPGSGTPAQAATAPLRPLLEELFNGKDRQSLVWLAAGLLLGLLLSWVF